MAWLRPWLESSEFVSPGQRAQRLHNRSGMPIHRRSRLAASLFANRSKLLSIASVVLVGGWLGVNVYPYAAPAPSLSEADLPSLPPASQNGWHALTSEALELELSQPLDSLVSSRLPAEQFWAEVDQRSDELDGLLASPGAREASRRIDAARPLPAFADACEVEASCHPFARHEAHVVALLRATQLAHVGAQTEALALVRDLIRFDAAQLASARSVISSLVALSDLADALDKANMIVARAIGRKVDARLHAELLALGRDVEALELETLDLRGTVVTDYLVQARAIDALAGAGRVPAYLTEIDGPRWLYSRALTLRSLERRTARRQRAAREGDVFGALGGGEPSETDAFAWWWRNPVGERALDRMRFDPTMLAEGIATDLDEVQRSRASLLRQISEIPTASCGPR